LWEGGGQNRQKLLIGGSIKERRQTRKVVDFVQLYVNEIRCQEKMGQDIFNSQLNTSN
jgi:hypothetical protein